MRYNAGVSEAVPSVSVTALLTVGAASATVLAWRLGCFRRDAFDRRPPEGPAFGALEFAAAILVFLLGAAAAASLRGAAKNQNVPPATAPAVAPSTSPSAVPATKPVDKLYGTRKQAKWMLAIQCLTLGSVATLTIFFATRERHGLRLLGILPRDGAWLTNLSAGVLGALFAIPVVFAVIAAITIVTDLLGLSPPMIAHDLLYDLRDADSPGTRWIILGSAIILAPLFEEIVFRGMVHTVMRRAIGPTHRWAAVFVAALIFTLIHLSVWPPALAGIFILGVVFSWLYERTGSLAPSFIVHAVFNAANCALVLLEAKSST